MSGRQRLLILLATIVIILAMGFTITRVFNYQSLTIARLSILSKGNPDVNELRAEVQGLKEQIRGYRSLLEEMACASKGIGARGGFCLKPDNINIGYNDLWDLRISEILENGIFKDQVVGDFGAGLGWYGMYWTRKQKPTFKHGKELEIKHFYNKTDVMDVVLYTPMKLKSWQGFDGAGNVETVTNGLVSYLDLSEKQDLGNKFDWVISLEVGEHIPAAFESIFIENLIRHACKGIVLSWAVEGQGGHFHVNNKNNDYVKKIFKDKGFTNLKETEDLLRKDAILGHFRNTVMVFQRDSLLEDTNCPY